jgi:hypothetical protein
VDFECGVHKYQMSGVRIIPCHCFTLFLGAFQDKTVWNGRFIACLGVFFLFLCGARGLFLLQGRGGFARIVLTG